VRWISIRHDERHIHIVVTLVRQDRRTAWARKDYHQIQTCCRELERHHGLHRVGAHPTTARYPTAAELNKASRQQRDEVPRHRLRRLVRAAAEAANHEHDFLDRLLAADLAPPT
jgi:hypothetical protein